jgi:hypothetical protein
VTESHNLAAFLGRIKDSDQTRGHLPVRSGDLLVVDEASMVPTKDLAAVEAIATRQGAKILLTGDTEQLSAPGSGGALRLLADEHGYYQLRTVQRFEQDWEREASLRLRAGDTDVLAEYDQRGRILDGTREQMADAAYQRWLADHLSGKTSVLLTGTNVGRHAPRWRAGRSGAWFLRPLCDRQGLAARADGHTRLAPHARLK